MLLIKAIRQNRIRAYTCIILWVLMLSVVISQNRGVGITLAVTLGPLEFTLGGTTLKYWVHA